MQAIEPRIAASQSADHQIRKRARLLDDQNVKRSLGIGDNEVLALAIRFVKPHAPTLVDEYYKAIDEFESFREAGTPRGHFGPSFPPESRAKSRELRKRAENASKRIEMRFLRYLSTKPDGEKHADDIRGGRVPISLSPIRLTTSEKRLQVALDCCNEHNNGAAEQYYDAKNRGEAPSLKLATNNLSRIFKGAAESCPRTVDAQRQQPPRAPAVALSRQNAPMPPAVEQ